MTTRVQFPELLTSFTLLIFCHESAIIRLDCDKRCSEKIEGSWALELIVFIKSFSSLVSPLPKTHLLVVQSEYENVLTLQIWVSFSGWVWQTLNFCLSNLKIFFFPLWGNPHRPVWVYTYNFTQLQNCYNIFPCSRSFYVALGIFGLLILMLQQVRILMLVHYFCLFQLLTCYFQPFHWLLLAKLTADYFPFNVSAYFNLFQLYMFLLSTVSMHIIAALRVQSCTLLSELL